MALFNRAYMEIKVTFKVGRNQYSQKYLEQCSRELQLRMNKGGFKFLKGTIEQNETVSYFIEPEG